MSMDMVGELTDVLGGAEADPGSCGSGARQRWPLCAGGDIGDMAQARMKMAAGDPDAMAAVNAKFGRLCLVYALAIAHHHRAGRFGHGWRVWSGFACLT